LESRIIDLEIKFTHQDELLGELNEIVTNQQFIIAKLEKEIKTLQSSMDLSEGGSSRSAKDDIPPHY
jgi:SlyX protein